MASLLRSCAVLVAGAVVTGCAMGASMSSSAGATTPSNPSSSASTSSRASDDAARAPSSGIHGAIVRSQLETLNGLSPDEAKARLKSFGHDGKVSLGEVTNSGGGHAYIESCGVNKVCGTSGSSGISVHDDITLYLNPTLTIAPPP